MPCMEPELERSTKQISVSSSQFKVPGYTRATHSKPFPGSTRKDFQDFQILPFQATCTPSFFQDQEKKWGMPEPLYSKAEDVLIATKAKNYKDGPPRGEIRIMKTKESKRLEDRM